jgi:bifunctional DNA-binding transcriptional regulator/antitoxin component of YhaV-PrlF toxin-antitoxin module
MVVGKVRAGDQISLPVEIQQAVGIEPGDLVSIDVTASGAVVIRRLPALTLSEALNRYRIEGPIEDAADRVGWQDVAARDVLGADERG